MITSGLSRGVKRPGREAKHSPLTNAEVGNTFDQQHGNFDTAKCYQIPEGNIFYNLELHTD
jgi:hypothetical protein